MRIFVLINWAERHVVHCETAVITSVGCGVAGRRHAGRKPGKRHRAYLRQQ
jgi:hypothetical protein